MLVLDQTRTIPLRTEGYKKKDAHRNNVSLQYSIPRGHRIVFMALCGSLSVTKTLPVRAVLKVRVKCNEDDTIGDLKKLIAAQVGTRPEKIRIQKWYTIYKVPPACLSVL